MSGPADALAGFLDGVELDDAVLGDVTGGGKVRFYVPSHDHEQGAFMVKPGGETWRPVFVDVDAIILSTRDASD